MSTEKPNPRCCSECVHYNAFPVPIPQSSRLYPNQGECVAPIPWWADTHEVDNRIYLPETLAENCPCFLPKP